MRFSRQGVAFADICHSAAVGRARLPWWVCVDGPEALATAEPSDGPPPEIPAQAGKRVALPLYPFQRQSYWAQPRRAVVAAPRGAHPLLGRRLRSGLAQVQHEALLAPDEPGWLADHAVGGRVVVPAAALVEMMLAAAPDGTELTSVGFHQMLVPAEQPLVQTVADPAASTVTVFAAADGDAPVFSRIATATWQASATAAGGDPAGFERAVFELARAVAIRPVDLAALYDRFAAAGLAYGPAFRGLRRLSGGDRVAVAELAAPDPVFRLDPRVLDAAWQSLAAALPPDSSNALLPTGVDRLVWRGGIPSVSVLRLVAPDRGDLALFDAAGQVVVWCEGLRLAAATGARAGAVLHETTWDPVPLGEEVPDWIDCRDEQDPVAACWQVLEAFRNAGEKAPRLAVLARHATEAGGTVPLPAQAALVGLVATLALERPELRPLLLDLDDTAVPPPVPAESGPLLAWRDGELLAPRLAPRSASACPVPPGPFSLARGAAATLDDLHWGAASRRTPGAGEVEIEIAAAGINFRDVMNLLGVYPGDGGAPGVECAGTDRRGRLRGGSPGRRRSRWSPSRPAASPAMSSPTAAWSASCRRVWTPGSPRRSRWPG